MRKFVKAISPAIYGAGSMTLVCYFPNVAGVLFGVFMLVILVLALFR